MEQPELTKECIPASLLAQLTRLKPALREQGCVQRHYPNTPFKTYRLRYRHHVDGAGYVIHRSLALGDDEGVVNAVRTLLDQWKAEAAAQAADEAKQAAERLAAERMACKQERMLRQILSLCSGRRHKVSVGRQGGSADPDGDPDSLISQLFACAVGMSGKTGRPGRPRKKPRLW